MTVLVTTHEEGYRDLCGQLLSVCVGKEAIRKTPRLLQVPQPIITDQEVQFTSKFWHKFLKLLGSSQSLSSAHHLQTSCECKNVMLDQYLRCYVNYQQDKWAELLPFAKEAYNNSVHSRTSFTPFRIATGIEFVPMPDLPQQTPSNGQMEVLESLCNTLVRAHLEHCIQVWLP